MEPTGKRLVIDLPYSSGVQLHPTSLPGGPSRRGRVRAGWTGSPTRARRGGRCSRSARPTATARPTRRRRRSPPGRGCWRSRGRAGLEAEELDFREREALLDRGLGGVRPARRDRGPGALRPRVDGAARVRRRSAACGSSATSRSTSRRAAPTTARTRSCSAPAPWPARRPTPTPTRASCGATRSTTGRRCSRARLPLVDRPAAAHVRALRPRADRPLPRLRLLLGGAGGARSTRSSGALEARARGGGCSTPPRAGSARAAADRRGPRRHHPGGRAAARRPRPPGHGRAPVRLRPGRPAERAPPVATTSSTRVVYTGTHDNDTVRGWYESLPPERRALVDAASTRRGVRGGRAVVVADPARVLLPARVAMVQAQDVLGLGSEARMNVPGTKGHSWRWRLERAARRAGARGGCGRHGGDGAPRRPRRRDVDSGALVTGRPAPAPRRRRDPRRQPPLPRRRGRRLRRQVGHRLRRGRPPQVLGKLTSCSARRPGRSRARSRSARAPATSRSTSCRPGVVRTPRAPTSPRACSRRWRPTPRALGLDVETVACDAAAAAVRGRVASTSCSATPCCTTCPISTRAFAEFAPRAARPAGRCSSPASRRARRPHRRRRPSARRCALAPVWRRRRCAPGRAARPRRRPSRRRTRSSPSSTSTRSPRRPAGAAPAARASPTCASAARSCSRTGSAGSTARSRPSADHDDIPWRGSSTRSAATSRCRSVDRALLEPRLPPRVFYNLMLAARKP